MNASQVIAAYERTGRYFSAGGVQSFVLDEGQGEAVVCMHGVPASAFLYRKVVRELAARGLRGIAFDLPGLGLAERPADFDYTWTGLGRFATAAVESLGLDRFHLVVHDVGGPVGFEVAAAFLKIMRGFELTREKRDLYVGVLRSHRYPVQIVWGAADPALKLRTYGERARLAAGLDVIHRLPGKHFLQEDQAPALADRIAALVRP
jgi:pimeloyl-ACP methyl ester carboxylesterase